MNISVLQHSLQGSLLLVLWLFFGCGQTTLAQPSAPEFDLSPGKKIIIKDSVFKQGSEKFESASLPALVRLSKYLADRPQLEIEIAGHADNAGSEEQNYALSLARAEIIKRFLVDRGITPFRITTKGFGSRRPLASNTTREGQSQNRRVEIVGLSPVSRRPLTNERGEPLTPDGAVTAIQRNVTSFAPWSLDWFQARLRQPIYEYYKLNTLADSRSEITFSDNSTLNVGENALVVVYGSQRTDAPRFTRENVELVKGSLLLNLRKMRVQDTFAVRAKGGQMAFAHGRAKIANDSRERPVLSVFQGGANVRFMRGGVLTDAGVSVPEKFGIRLNPEGAISQVQPLPQMPELVEPSGEAVAGKSLRFRWRATTEKTRFEVTDDSSFTRLVYGAVTDKRSADVALEAGKYFLRVSALDTLGLESPPFEMVLRVQPKGYFSLPSLMVRGLEFALLVAAAGLGWMSVLLRRDVLRWIAVVLFVIAIALFVFTGR